MNKEAAQLLEQHFDTAFAAPDGIAKLRELILTLAMQGKLVEQDPNDPPASEILKEIEAERKRGSHEGTKTRRKEKLPPIKPEEVPYELPQGWEWVRLGKVVEILDSLRKPVTKQDREPGPYPYYGASGIVDYVSNYIFDEPLVLVGEDGAKWEKGDNTAFSISGKTWVNNHAHVLRPDRSVLNDGFLIYCLVGMDMQPYITGTTVPKLNQARLVSILVPLPPLPEQHRIVARIDQLMARCDELERLRKEREEKRMAVHAAVVRQLLDAPGPSAHLSGGLAWEFIQHHFGALYTVKENVDELRKAILQLAVMGRLVPQDPNDPPASELLKEIEAEKQRMVKAGKIKRPKPLPPIKPEEVPYELPKGWVWVRVLDVAQLITSGSRDWAKYYSDAGAIFVTMGNLSRGSYQLRKDTIRYVTPPSKEEGSRTKLEEMDLLISITGEVGNLGLIPANFGEAYINQHTCLLRFMDNCKNRYFPELMRSPLVKEQFDKPQRGIKNSFRLGDVGETIIPLPPLSEQHRIVARIDQLMALCDTLDYQIEAATDKRTELLNALMVGI